MTGDQHSTTDQATPSDHVVAGHEPNTFRVKVAVIALAGVLSVCVVSFAIMFALYRGLTKPVERRDEAEASSTFVEASREQVEPKLSRGGPSQLREMREAARRTLDSYAWIDEQAGVARVPISQAMEMILNEGLPVQKERTTDESPPATNQ